MGKYRKKPVVVEAHLWEQMGDHPRDGGHKDEGAFVRPYMGANKDDDANRRCDHCDWAMAAHGWIDTLEGGHIVCPGDMVITGVAGEIYPCKPNIFEQTYEAIEKETA